MCFGQVIGWVLAGLGWQEGAAQNCFIELRIKRGADECVVANANGRGEEGREMRMMMSRQDLGAFTWVQTNALEHANHLPTIERIFPPPILCHWLSFPLHNDDMSKGPNITISGNGRNNKH